MKHLQYPRAKSFLYGKALLLSILIAGSLICTESCTKNDPVDPAAPTPTPPAPFVASIPVVITNATSSVTTTTFMVGGNVTSNGGDSVTQRGICYSTSQNPTTADQKINSGSGNGSFTAVISGLMINTAYYARAFSINSAGTAYGAQVAVHTFTSAFLIKATDPAAAINFDTLQYNSQGFQNRFAAIYGTSPGLGHADSFLYANQKLIASYYSNGPNFNIATPYSHTDYIYQNNILASSKYYLGLTNLVTTSIYTFDGSGRLSTVKQTQINGGVGSYPTHTTRYEYDANSNISKIFYREPPYAEYMHMEFLNYDNHPNPYYNLPWEFDYNIFQFNADKISKNNVGRINIYSSFQGSAPILNGGAAYTYEYDLDGKVSRRNGTSPARLYTYGYQ
jgi:hypothetical protein